MTVRYFSDVQKISSTASPGTVIYTAPKVGGAETIINVYATNVDGAAARNISVVIDKGSAHAAQELVTVVDAYPVQANFPQLKIATVTLKGHRTDPDTLGAFGSVANDISLVLKIEEHR